MRKEPAGCQGLDSVLSRPHPPPSFSGPEKYNQSLCVCTRMCVCYVDEDPAVLHEGERVCEVPSVYVHR